MPNQIVKKGADAFACRPVRMIAATTLLATLLIRTLAATNASTMLAPPISVNGSHVRVEGLERKNSVFVPVRGVFEKLGATVTYNGSFLAAKQHGKELTRMTVGSRSATVNGSARTLAVAPFISGGVVMLPLRVISEAAEASVAYVSSPRSVNVYRVAAAGAMAGGAAVAAAGTAATVAQAAAPPSDVASATPVADNQTNQSGIPWWVWALLALLVLGLIFWAITRRRKDPVITTSSSARGSEPTITTRK